MAAGISIARQCNAEILVDTGLLLDHAPGRHAVNRKLDLNIFDIPLIEAPLLMRIRNNAHGLGYDAKVLTRILKKLFPLDLVCENSFAWRPIDIYPLQGHVIYLQGLWQSWRYFNEYQHEVRSAFTFARKLPAEFDSLIEVLQADSTIAIHVRRGDYVANPKDASTIGFVGLGYYRRAVAALARHLNSGFRFVVFSDDLTWCASNLNWLPGPLSFVEVSPCNNILPHHLDFQLLSTARNFIISNSSFAWWAAWLSRYSDKVVVAPFHWFNDLSIDSSQLCPPSWIRV